MLPARPLSEPPDLRDILSVFLRLSFTWTEVQRLRMWCSFPLDYKGNEGTALPTTQLQTKGHRAQTQAGGHGEMFALGDISTSLALLMC